MPARTELLSDLPVGGPGAHRSPVLLQLRMFRRSTPFRNGDKPQLCRNGCDVAGVFVDVNGEPIAGSTTRGGAIACLWIQMNKNTARC